LVFAEPVNFGIDTRSLKQFDLNLMAVDIAWTPTHQLVFHPGSFVSVEAWVMDVQKADGGGCWVWCG